MKISTLGLTFSIRSRRLAQGILKSLAQTDISGSLRVCKRKSLRSWLTFSSFLADPSERQPHSQAALYWGQECPDQRNARVGLLWCHRDCEGVADVPPWVGHLRLSSHHTLLQILPNGSFEMRDNGLRRDILGLYIPPLLFLHQRPTLAWRSACIVPATLSGPTVTSSRMHMRCLRSGLKVRLRLLPQWRDNGWVKREWVKPLQLAKCHDGSENSLAVDHLFI